MVKYHSLGRITRFIADVRKEVKLKEVHVYLLVLPLGAGLVTNEEMGAGLGCLNLIGYSSHVVNQGSCDSVL